MKRLRDESGAMIVFGSVTVLAIVVFMCLILKYTSNVRDSIRLSNMSAQIAQGMHVFTPYKGAALTNGAYIAHLLGFTDAQALETEQTTVGGKITMKYESDVIPHVAWVKLEYNMDILDGLFQAVMPGGGLKATQTKSDMGSTSLSPFLSVFVDMSFSMLNLGNLPSGNAGYFDLMLDAAGLPKGDPPPDNGDPIPAPEDICHPLSIKNCSDWGFAPARAVAAATFDSSNPVHTGSLRACCNWMRSLLIGFIACRAHHFQDITTPGDVNKFGYRLYNPLQTQDKTVVFNRNPGRAPNAYDRPWRVFNPTFPYWDTSVWTTKDFDGAKAMQEPSSGNPKIDFSYPLTCVKVWTNEQDGFTAYPPESDEVQVKYMNLGGLRLVDYDLDATKVQVTDGNGDSFLVAPVSCSTATECARVANTADPPVAIMETWPYTTGWNVTDQHMCFRVWDYNTHWYTAEEMTYCNVDGGGLNIENPGATRCHTQKVFLNYLANDLVQAYKRLTQSFLIAASDIIPSILFATFTAPTPKGNVANTENGERFTGVTILFNGNDYDTASHIYETKVDKVKIKKVDVSGNVSDYEKRRNFGFGASYNRETEMRSYFNGGVYTNSFPEPNLTSDTRTDSNYSYWKERQLNDPALYVNRKEPRLQDGVHPKRAYLGVKNWLDPLVHPDHPWPFELDGAVISDGRKGRAISNELTTIGDMRHNWVTPAEYNISFYGDTWVIDNSHLQYFPATGPMQILENYFDTTWHNTNFNPPLGIYDHPPLFEINANTGVQDGTYTEYGYEKVWDFAPALFANTTVRSGGTDHWGVMYKARVECQNHKAKYGADEPCVNVVLTDGKPNLEVSEAVDPWIPAPLSFDQHMTKIQEELTAYENLSNVFTIVLYIENTTPDSETNQFLNLFRCAESPCEKKRALLYINYKSVSEYILNLKDALSTIIMLIRASSKLTDESDVDMG